MTLTPNARAKRGKMNKIIEDLYNLLMHNDYCARYTLYPEKKGWSYDQFRKWYMLRFKVEP